MSAVEEAQVALDAWHEAHRIDRTDPGMQSMRFHRTEAQQTKHIRQQLNQLRRESRELERLEENLLRAQRAERLAAQPTTPVDPATLKGATAVQVLTRGIAEWHRVVRVNKTTVTCWAEPGMDQPKYPHHRIVGVRHPDQENTP